MKYKYIVLIVCSFLLLCCGCTTNGSIKSTPAPTATATPSRQDSIEKAIQFQISVWSYQYTARGVAFKHNYSGFHINRMDIGDKNWSANGSVKLFDIYDREHILSFKASGTFSLSDKNHANVDEFTMN